MLSQKDAVYQAVQACKKADGVFDRKDVIDYLVAMFEQGHFEIGSEEKRMTDKSRRDYIGQAISNWLRKDPRLSGESEPSTRERRKKPRPADDEMKRLMMAKVVLVKEGKATEEIDQLIAQRTTEIVSQRSQSKNEAEARARELLGI